MDKESNSKYNELELKCKRCQKIWQYAGSNPYYATCTFCKTSVNIRKNKIPTDAMIGVSHQPDRSLRGKPS